MATIVTKLPEVGETVKIEGVACTIFAWHPMTEWTGNAASVEWTKRAADDGILGYLEGLVGRRTVCIEVQTHPAAPGAYHLRRVMDF